MESYIQCIDDGGEVEFTTGNIYKISEKGLVDDQEFTYSSFLQVESGTLAEKWLWWISHTPAKFETLYELTKKF